MRKSKLVTIGIVFSLFFMFISTLSAVEVKLLESKQYLRNSGKPDVYTDTFPGRVGTASILIKNGEEDGSHRVSSVKVLINGEEIFETKDFSQNVFELTQSINIIEGNEITVELNSIPGSYITVEIIQEIEAEGAGVVGPEGGLIEITDSTSSLNGVRIEIPEFALEEFKVITIENGSKDLNVPNHYNTSKNPIKLQPEGLVFNKNYTLYIPSNGLSNRTFAYYNKNGNMWELIDTLLNSETNYFIVSLNHFSELDWFISSFTENRNFEINDTVNYFIDTSGFTNTDMNDEDIKIAIRDSIKAWEDVLYGNLVFIEVDKREEAKIIFEASNNPIVFWNEDKWGYAGIKIFSGQWVVLFNGKISWHYNKVLVTSTHELGHTLGLPHICPEKPCTSCKSYSGIMSPYIDSSCPELSQIDIDRIQELYDVQQYEPGTILKTLGAPSGTRPNGLGYDGEHLWVSSYGHESNPGLYKIDTNDGTNLDYRKPPSYYYLFSGVACDENYVWYTYLSNSRFNKYNPENNSIIFSVAPQTYYGYRDLAWDGQYLWGVAARRIIKISPITGEVLKIHDYSGVTNTSLLGLTFDGKNLLCSFANTIYKIDPESGDIICNFDVPLKYDLITGLAWDGQYLWACTSQKRRLYKIVSCK